MNRTKRTHYPLIILLATGAFTLFYFFPWLLLFSAFWFLGHLYVGQRRIKKLKLEDKPVDGERLTVHGEYR